MSYNEITYTFFIHKTLQQYKQYENLNCEIICAVFECYCEFCLLNSVYSLVICVKTLPQKFQIIFKL